MLPDEEERLRMRLPPHALPLMRQRWERLGFLHWRVDAAEIAAHLPPGLDVDTFDGDAYVGLVPFTIRGARPLLLPGVPGLSSFHELNFRTYVHRAGRDPGVWFFSLDAASRIVAALARRSYRLPYHHARMAMVESGGAVSFRSQRTDGSPATFACTYAPEGRAVPAAVGSLPFFLVERYLLYSWDGRRLHTARVWHRSYPLQAARVTDLDEDLTAEAGFHTDVGRRSATTATSSTSRFTPLEELRCSKYDSPGEVGTTTVVFERRSIKQRRYQQTPNSLYC